MILRRHQHALLQWAATAGRYTPESHGLSAAVGSFRQLLAVNRLHDVGSEDAAQLRMCGGLGGKCGVERTSTARSMLSPLPPSTSLPYLVIPKPSLFPRLACSPPSASLALPPYLTITPPLPSAPSPSRPLASLPAPPLLPTSSSPRSERTSTARSMLSPLPPAPRPLPSVPPEDVAASRSPPTCPKKQRTACFKHT